MVTKLNWDVINQVQLGCISSSTNEIKIQGSNILYSGWQEEMDQLFYPGSVGKDRFENCDTFIEWIKKNFFHHNNNVVM
jgi:hypothetical protein